ncbi:peptidoglycan-recognition protein SC2-like [Macrosteles quadrilineatus]|uniref:peptidoglycan-recognition protein SC2-like n=1 Tax=Macrosteles quadrilineatus TaxID=74068 RepID=UPI0023E0B599|nr:peptidoglycan-recognition protein SC2-like [Macrosteles quadrilineatus]XP_054265113.1 peptidoglycan-recognition protein SC2-like [Macrosteles quadrilineatus]
MPKKKKAYDKIPSYRKYDSEDDNKIIDPDDDPRNMFTKQWKFFTREQWGAKPGFAHRPLHTPVRKLRVIYDLNMDRCTVTKTCKKIVFGIQRRHLHLGWPDINLNFVIAGDGNVYEGLGWTKKIIRLPHHSLETGNTLAIGCIGRYNRLTLPRRIKKTLDLFIKKSVEDGYIVKEIFNGEFWRIKQSCKL